MTDIKTTKPAKTAKKFICEKCDFICYKKCNYTDHLSTLKHTILTSDLAKIAKLYSCVCGKEYKHSQSLYTHKKTCQTLIQNDTTNKMIELLQQNNELLIQNQDLKEVIVEQKDLILEQKEVIIGQTEYNKLVLEKVIEQTEIAKEQKYLAMDQAEEQTEHNKRVIELAIEQKELAIEQKEISIEQKELMTHIKEKGLSNVTNIQNQTNHFNLNNFLNIECKDAITVEEMNKLIKNYKISNEQMECYETGNHVTGACNLINNMLDGMPVNERPVHCSDLKRETMHWKNKEGIWEKEDDTGSRPYEKTFMQYVNANAFDSCVKWQKAVLDIYNNDKDEDRYSSTLRHVMGPVNEPAKQVISSKKIRTHIAKKTLIQK
jgi:hypothetical protein